MLKAIATYEMRMVIIKTWRYLKYQNNKYTFFFENNLLLALTRQ